MAVVTTDNIVNADSTIAELDLLPGEGQRSTFDLHTTAGDRELESLDDEDEYPLIPWCDTTSDEFGTRWVDYSDRGPLDAVISGPVTGGWGPGRWHRNRRIAYWVCAARYGADKVKPMRQSSGRWSFLVKGLKNAA